MLSDGESGELVFTSPSRTALPIIRYRTRDLMRLLPGEGAPMRRIDRISCRSDDMIIVRGVNLFPTQLEELLLQRSALSALFLLELTRPDRLDEIALHVEGRPAATAISVDEAVRALAAPIKDATGLSVAIRPAAPGTLQRSTGKASRVDDRRSVGPG